MAIAIAPSPPPRTCTRHGNDISVTVQSISAESCFRFFRCGQLHGAQTFVCFLLCACVATGKTIYIRAHHIATRNTPCFNIFSFCVRKSSSSKCSHWKYAFFTFQRIQSSSFQDSRIPRRESSDQIDRINSFACIATTRDATQRNTCGMH